MKHIILSILVILLSACGQGIPDEEDIKARYNYSSDVGHFKILHTLPMELKGHQCHFILWELEAIQLFKGSMKPKEIIRIWGPNQADYWQAGSERIMFIGHYKGESYDACSEHMFTTYKVADSCCEITGSGKNQEVHFITMVNSEERGPDISVNSQAVFQKLRSYAEN